MPALNEPKYMPIRDLSEEQLRLMIGVVTTVKTYRSAESAEPQNVLTGKLRVVGTDKEGTVTMAFDGAFGYDRYTEDRPVTILVPYHVQIV